MPRVLLKRKKPLSTKEKMERKDTWSVRGGLTWIDPYPWIIGTLPEKKVYAYLISTGIPFMYQTEVDVSVPEVKYYDWARPDFVIPSLNIVIQVNGDYWHSSEESQAKDNLSNFFYETAGYKVIPWWEWETESMAIVELAMRDIPALVTYAGPHVGEVITVHKKYIDDTKGLSESLSKRKDYFNWRAKIVTRKSTRKKGVLSYEPK